MGETERQTEIFQFPAITGPIDQSDNGQDLKPFQKVCFTNITRILIQYGAKK